MGENQKPATWARGLCGSHRRQIIDCLSKQCYIETLAGIPWRELPSRFGDFRAIHTRLSRGSKTGVWEQVFEDLAEDADNEYAMIDKAGCPRPSTQRGCKGGMHLQKPLVAALVRLTTKIHAVVDALGNPLSFHLTPGQACDLDGADQLLPQHSC